MPCPLTRNYHTHTARCGHAKGSDEEYVLSAIKAGIRVLGFSDHVILPDIEQPDMRGKPSMLEDYLSSIASLKEKYKDQITIYTGFEVEWFERYESYYRDLLSSGKVDYLIQGQHALFIGGDIEFYMDVIPVHKAMEHYIRRIEMGAESNIISYIAHPDVYLYYFQVWNKQAKDGARRICEAAKKAKIPLELNMGYVNTRGRAKMDGKDEIPYPYGPFWDIVAEEGVDVIIGVDAHRPWNFEKGDFEWILDFASKHRLHLVDEITFKKGK